MDKILLSANGHNCLVELLPDRIRLVRQGVGSFLIHGLKGEKEIFYSDITSVQFKSPGIFTGGYMQLSFAGGVESKRGYMEALKDENTVIFHKCHLKDFELLKSELNKKIAKAKKPAPNQLNSLFELEKLAELKDKGILTEEEFSQKKKQLLNSDNDSEVIAQDIANMKQRWVREDSQSQANVPSSSKKSIGCLSGLLILFNILLSIGVLEACNELSQYIHPALGWIAFFVIVGLPVLLRMKFNLKWNKLLLWTATCFVGLFIVGLTVSSSPAYQADMEQQRNKEEAEKAAKAQTAQEQSATQETKTVNVAHSLNFDNFMRVQPGMTYQQVENILGPGELLSQVNIANLDTRMYAWKNWTGSNANITFQNGRVVSKAQFGLN